jgi:hypothetical protein
VYFVRACLDIGVMPVDIGDIAPIQLNKAILVLDHDYVASFYELYVDCRFFSCSKTHRYVKLNFVAYLKL